MNNINLHGRLPEDLPDVDTIDDILLELKDTKNFEINWINLQSMGSYVNWRAQNKVFDNWVERGQISIMKCEPNIPTFTPSDDWSNIPMSTMTYKETRYDIFRYPIRLEVKLQANSTPINHVFRETIESAKETYLRIKDYLGPDVIQDQIDLTSFTIDFMFTKCKVI